MSVKGQVTEAKIERFIRGCENAGKTVHRVIIDGNRVEVLGLIRFRVENHHRCPA